MPDQPPKLVKASLQQLPSGTPLVVHFNPASLVYTVENSVSQQSGGPKKVQYVAQFSGKLSMDLQFDTTDTGVDVRTFTNQVALFMQASGNAAAAASNASAPADSSGGSTSSPAKAPPVLMFQWGSYQFQGIMESFKETIDFFSSDGVALRALVSIGLARQDLVFDEGTQFKSASTAGSLVPSGSGDSALSVATRGGDPTAARQIGVDNGLESLRFTGGSTLQINAGVQLNPPSAFVTVPSASSGGSLGFGLSASSGAGIGIGGSAGIGGGASVGGSASIAGSPGILGGISGSSSIAGSASLGSSGIGVTAGPPSGGSSSAEPTRGAVFGSSASAGVAASAGAFAGLQVGRATVSSTARLNPTRILPSTVATDVSTFAGASFDLGGRARSRGSGGLSTDVGTRFSINDRLRFDSDD